MQLTSILKVVGLCTISVLLTIAAFNFKSAKPLLSGIGSYDSSPAAAAAAASASASASEPVACRLQNSSTEFHRLNIWPDDSLQFTPEESDWMGQLLVKHRPSLDTMADLLYQMKTRKQIDFNFIGGSITFNRVWTQLCQQFQAAGYETNCRWGGVPAIGPYYFFRCLSNHLDVSKDRPNIIVIELSANDLIDFDDFFIKKPTTSAEQLLRRIVLEYPEAMIIVTMFGVRSFPITNVHWAILGARYNVGVYSMILPYDYLLRHKAVNDKVIWRDTIHPTHHGAYMASMLLYNDLQTLLHLAPPTLPATAPPPYFYPVTSADIRTRSFSVATATGSGNITSLQCLTTREGVHDRHISLTQTAVSRADRFSFQCIDRTIGAKCAWIGSGAGAHLAIPITIRSNPGVVQVGLTRSAEHNFGWVKIWLDDDQTNAIETDGYWTVDANLVMEAHVTETASLGPHIVHVEIMDKQPTPLAGQPQVKVEPVCSLVDVAFS